MIRWTPEPALITTPLLTRSQFTNEFAAVLRSRFPTVEAQVIGESQIKFKAPEKAESGGFLDNAYAHYMLAPEEKDSIIEKYAISFHETAEGISGKIDRSRIVPVLKDKAWLEEMHLAMKARGEGKTPTSVHELYNEDLTIVYAEDNPKKACANLKRLLADPDSSRTGEFIEFVRAAITMRACFCWTNSGMSQNSKRKGN